MFSCTHTVDEASASARAVVATSGMAERWCVLHVKA
jgi:hypothetical protein